MYFTGVNAGIIYARNPTFEFDSTLLEGEAVGPNILRR